MGCFPSAIEIANSNAKTAQQQHNQFRHDTCESVMSNRESGLDSSSQKILCTSNNQHMIQVSEEESLNCQSNLYDLYGKGFITPNQSHFIRNHGKVPSLKWKEHELHVKGMVKNPTVFSMDELVSMPCVTLPVSITSGSNRAKEFISENPTTALNWGAAATACSFWTGVRLNYLLKVCQVDFQRAKYVRFEASGSEELSNGSYSSSMDIASAIDPLSDIIIAYKQNGSHLRGESGFPIRAVTPGWIGARMVKWLSTIEVTETSTNNYYYNFENRVFPSFVRCKLANAHQYWYQNQFVFNELNINSVIAHPFHKLALKVSSQKKYEIKGYAYSGNGRKITRVEVSFDQGQTWNICQLFFPEEEQSHAPQYGKYYCWMFWKYDVEVLTLVKAAKTYGELRCRAWDQSNNTQPKEKNWNMLGCGNNSHFVVKAMYVPGIRSQTEQKESRETDSYLKFLHPTVAGNDASGWMKNLKRIKETHSNPQDEESSNIEQSQTTTGKSGQTEQDGEGHHERNPDICMIPVSKAISNTMRRKGNNYLSIQYIPGFSMFGGRIEDFVKNSKTSNSSLSQTSIKDLARPSNGKVVSRSSRQERAAFKPLQALDPDAWLSFELIEKKNISYDTRILKFKLPSPNHYLGVPVGQHVLVRIIVNGNPLIRAYTPITSEKQLGFFTLCVKIYLAGADVKHPDGGKMSQFLDCMLLGDSLSITGPHGQVHYKRNGIFNFNGKEKKYRNVALLCGGTGITPAFQIMHEVYQNTSDKTNVYLLYANRTHYDVLLQADLDIMAEKRDNIHVWYTLERIPEVWMYSQGLITEPMIRERIPAPADDTLVLLCGPPKMIISCLLSLHNIGYQEEHVKTF